MEISRIAPRAIIIDAHVHLYPQSELEQLAWMKEGHVLRARHSLTEYREAVLLDSDVFYPANQHGHPSIRTSSGFRAPGRPTLRPALRGFVFIETDRISGLQTDSWGLPLEEAMFLRRLIAGKPKSDDGYTPGDNYLCKAIILWAPVPSGPSALASYREKALEAIGIARPLLKGWRYLLQDKKPGTMLEDSFIDGLKALGKWGEIFELGIDCRQQGIQQLREAIQCLERIYFDSIYDSEDEKVTIVINHMCKPNMYLSEPDPEWVDAIWKLAAFPKTYMKLSGGFSEIAPLPEDRKRRRPIRHMVRVCRAEDVHQHDADMNDDDQPELLAVDDGDVEMEDFREDANVSQPLQGFVDPRDASRDDTMTAQQAEEMMFDGVDYGCEPAYKKARAIIHKHLDQVWKSFGPGRCMFGSDWPVCNMGLKHNEEERGAWGEWADVVEKWVERMDMADEDRAALFGGVAAEVYGISELEWEAGLLDQIKQEDKENVKLKQRWGYTGLRVQEAVDYANAERAERDEDFESLPTRTISPQPYEAYTLDFRLAH